MKAAIIFTLILAAAILLTGCGHYGMGMGGHHYYNDQNAPISSSQNLDENSIYRQGGYWR